jgi:hypothetical protein
MLELRPSDRVVARLPAPVAQGVLKRIGYAMLAVLVPLAAASGYRAWFQVWSLDLDIDAPRVRPGSVISVSALTSGRVTVDLRLEILQDGRVDPIATDQVETARNPAMDPRPRRGAMTVVVTDVMADGWRPGPATLRVTARGRPQFMREPPPEIREVAVTVDTIRR